MNIPCGTQNTTLKHRIGLGWAAFQKHSKILKSKRLPTNVKVRTYLLYILPVVLYGLDCVTWNANLSANIEVFQNHCMRFITGHRLIEKTKISTLRELTSLPPLFDNIKSKTLFGHIKRSSVGLSKLCLEGMIQGNPGVDQKGDGETTFLNGHLQKTGPPSTSFLSIEFYGEIYLM